MGSRREYLSNKIVQICQRLDRKGFVANHDGNVTVKFERGYLATPTAEAKSEIVNEMVIWLDEAGNKIEGIGKPFSEMKLHLAAYRSRPEINAVVHAHPPYSMARGLCGGDFYVHVPEAVISLGERIPVVEFAMPGDTDSELQIELGLGLSDIVIMPGNGVLAVGADLEQAYLRIELLEHIIKIDQLAREMGTPRELSREQLFSLTEKRRQMGLGPKLSSPQRARSELPQRPHVSPSLERTLSETSSSHSKEIDIKNLIANEIRKTLKGFS